VTFISGRGEEAIVDVKNFLGVDLSGNLNGLDIDRADTGYPR